MRRLLAALALFLALVPMAVPAHAQTSTNQGRTVVLTNPLGTANVPTLIGNILKAAIGIVGALALLIFVYGGFLWLTSAGEAGKVEKGKEAMKWAIVGLAVVFSSYALVSFVLSTLTKV
ncbi:MAG TPA: pilin [Candidatus Baltobacteraceae bacterium]|nr:pilin [Candidatus Baltobacteraceae bacterium]